MKKVFDPHIARSSAKIAATPRPYRICKILAAITLLSGSGFTNLSGSRSHRAFSRFSCNILAGGILQAFGLLAVALCLLFFACLTVLAIKPLRDMALSAFWGSIYLKAGETVMTTEGGKTETLAIYKAKNKPFLIVGPCTFHDFDEERKTREIWDDFFFVNKKQLVRTATDKGGDIWVRLPRLLFILDDMSDRNDRVRLPFWDELEHKGASVRYDEATASYVYSLRINQPEQSVSFAVPEKLFTGDMPEAKLPD